MIPSDSAPWRLIVIAGSIIVGGFSLLFLSPASLRHRHWRRLVIVVVGSGVAAFSENISLY